MDLNNKISKHNILASALSVLLCLSLTACGSKKSEPTMLTCTGGDILNADRTACEPCTAGEFPDIDRTACVSSCPGGSDQARQRGDLRNGDGLCRWEDPQSRE